MNSLAQIEDSWHLNRVRKKAKYGNLIKLPYQRVGKKKKKKLFSKKKRDAIRRKAYAYRERLTENKTVPESKIEYILRELGVQFEFQWVFFTRYSFFIVDFYLPKHKIVIEVDGPSHYLDKTQVKYDKSRTRYFEKVRGLEVVRLTNNEVFELNIKAFFQELLEPLGYEGKSGSNPIVELSVKPIAQVGVKAGIELLPAPCETHSSQDRSVVSAE